MIRLNATRFLRPHQKYSAREWLPKHVQMPVGTETAGMPFSLAAFPHVDSVRLFCSGRRDSGRRRHAYH
jgi:hypothetical protein